VTGGTDRAVRAVLLACALMAVAIILVAVWLLWAGPLPWWAEVLTLGGAAHTGAVAVVLAWRVSTS
jgi:hypothetical protein